MSGRKSNLRQFQTITAGDMSQAAPIVSAVTNIQMLDNIGIQFNFTSAPTGDFTVDVSTDYAQDTYGNVTNAGNWIPITLSPAPAAAGAAGNIFINITEISAPWMRQTYTSTLLESGSITLVADVAGSLNSKYFTLNGADGDNWYVWYDNGSGVDPAPAGRTGIPVVYTTGDTASTLGGLTRTAMAGITSIDTIAGSTSHATFIQTTTGPGALADGTAATGFTFAYTAASGSLDAFITGKMI